VKRAALALVLFGSVAHAGGLARPNGISARGTGMGGAWTAWVDDATAVWFNPAALSEVEPQLDLGGEMVVGPRTYTPLAEDGTKGPAQQTTVAAPLPSIGAVGRFWYEDRPSRFTLGAGVWNTYGGQVSFPKTGMAALDATQDAVVEASAGTALRISDRLSIGAALRVGIGLFSIESTMLPFDAKLSATGVGVAMAWGFLFRPTDAVRIGLAWRSPLHISTAGSGTITEPSGPSQQSIEHEQNWPQQASLGLGWAAVPKLELAAQLDWTQWSSFDEIVVAFPSKPLQTQTYREDWTDSWTARLGGDYTVTNAVALRAGAYVDTSAVPDRTIERQYIDSLKVGISAGGSVTRAAWRIDFAVDAVLPNTRTVPNNSAETAAFPADRNKAPGDYRGSLLTLELAVARRF
jgi:long-chain fatty acid transport protein